jgi:dihydropteroate synthase
LSDLICGDYRLPTSRPLLMGIVNVTPDSFSDGGRFADASRAIEHAERLIDAGADIIDIGGESTRPGATPATAEQELERVLPVLAGIIDAGVPVSIDTQKTEVMRVAIDAGASMINDVNALHADGALALCAASGVAICLMHKQGAPADMQDDPWYEDVVAEVSAYLTARAAAAVTAGVPADRIVIDPGFGFGKTVAHNFTMLRELSAFTTIGYPVLAGLSRKSSLGAITSRVVEDRLAGSLAAALLAAQNGATILRVHDVRETVDVLKVWQAMRKK